MQIKSTDSFWTWCNEVMLNGTKVLSNDTLSYIKRFSAIRQSQVPFDKLSKQLIAIEEAVFTRKFYQCEVLHGITLRWSGSPRFKMPQASRCLNGRLEQIVTGRNQSAGNVIPAPLLLRHKKGETTCRFWIPQRFTEENSCFGEGFKFRCSPSCHHSKFKTQLEKKFRMRSIEKALDKKSKEERRIRWNLKRARMNKQ